MSERWAAITGATGGIGRWIALGLVDAGFRLLVIGRDPVRLHATRDWLAGQSPGSAGRIELITADLSLLADTRAAADAVVSRAGRLDLLVNNAGLLSPRRIETAEGHEHTLAVNHLAPFVLTEALLPSLRAADRARIVNVGSSTADRARINPDDLELERRWGMVRAYAQSKLALLMTSLSLAGQLDGSGISVNVVHPGMVATGLVRNRGVVGLAWRAMAPFLLSEQQGAETPLFAACSPDAAGLTGGYLKRCRPVPPNPLATDPALRARVLDATRRLVSDQRWRGWRGRG